MTGADVGPGRGTFNYPLTVSVLEFLSNSPLRSSGYVGYVDSNQGEKNTYKWVKNVPKS